MKKPGNNKVNYLQMTHLMLERETVETAEECSVLSNRELGSVMTFKIPLSV